MKTTYNLNITSTDDSDYNKSKSTSMSTNSPGDIVDLLRKFEELESQEAAPAVEPVMAQPAPCDAAIEEEGEELANAPKVKTFRDMLDVVATGHTNTAPNRITNNQGDNPLVQEEDEESKLENQLMKEWRATKLQAISENFNTKAAEQAIVQGLETYIDGMNTFSVRREQGYIKVFPILEDKAMDGAPLLVVSEDMKTVESDSSETVTEAQNSEADPSLWDRYELKHESTGNILKKGDVVKDFRGAKHEVLGFELPRHAASTGRVYTNKGTFFPSVVDAKIVPREPAVEAVDNSFKADEANWKHYVLQIPRTGKIIDKGDVVKDRSGNEHTVLALEPPKYPGSWGQISTDQSEKLLPSKMFGAKVIVRPGIQNVSEVSAVETLREEELSDSPVASTLARAVMHSRSDLLTKYGLSNVISAINQVASFVGDVEEIGSSDRGIFIGYLEDTLKNEHPDLDSKKSAGTRPEPKIEYLGVVPDQEGSEKIDEGNKDFDDMARKYAQAAADQEEEEGRYSKEYPGGEKQKAADLASFLKKFPPPIAEASQNTTEDWITKPGQDRDRPAHVRKREHEDSLPDDDVSKKFRNPGDPNVPAAQRKKSEVDEDNLADILTLSGIRRPR